MGVLYEQGLSVDLNLEAAFGCYAKAAELGCIKSNTKVAHMYYSGVKARKFEDFDDDDIAAYMSTQVTQSELEDMKFTLKPDRMQALKRYLKSAKNGDSEASNCAGLMLEKINPVEAVDCYRHSLELDGKNTDAMLNLALLYYTTREEREWHEEALRLMQRASNLGNEKAHAYLEQRGLLGHYMPDESRLATPFVTTMGTMGLRPQRKRIDGSIRKEVTLQWDLTKTHIEPSLKDDETVSYQLTQTNTMGIGFDLSRKDSQP